MIIVPLWDHIISVYSVASDRTQPQLIKRSSFWYFTVHEYPCQRRLRAVSLHLLFGIEYLWSICGSGVQRCEATISSRWTQTSFVFQQQLPLKAAKSRIFL